MEHSQFLRSEMILGENSTNILSDKNVILFGLGGVGSYTAEALARAGIGKLTIVDNDTVSVTNINRQLCALHSTVGKPKVEVVRERILDINPECKITAFQKFYLPENSDEFNLNDYNYIADAIDTVSAKIDLAKKSQELGIPIISCMGTGNKLDPTAFRVVDIHKTKVCPLARVMRYELKKLGIKDVKAVYSEEEPIKPAENPDDPQAGFRRSIPASNAFVPSVAGLIAAGEVIKDLAGIK